MANNYLQLLLYKTYADLRAESERTYAGIFWWFAEPLLHMAIYYIVFAVFFHRATENYVPFLLIGLISWRWFHTTLTQGAASILNGKRLMLQVYIPKTIFPNVALLSNSCKFAITLAMLLLFLWLYGLTPTIYYVALPLVLLVQFLFIAACTYFMASIIPFVPDLKIVLDNVLRALVFLSGIFYSGTSIPEKLQFWFYLNPMAALIECYRDVLLYGHWPHWEWLNWIVVASMFIMYAGKYIIRRCDYLYPKVIP